MMARANRTKRARQELAPAAGAPARTQEEVVLAHGMSRMRSPQVVPPGPRAAARLAKVGERSLRLVSDLEAGPPCPDAQLPFEPVGHGDEVLVEATDLDQALSLRGEVAAHHLGRRLWNGRTKCESAPFEGLRLLAWLEDLTADERARMALVRAQMGAHEVGAGDHVIVAIDHDVAPRGEQGVVHCAGDRRLRAADPPEPPRRLEGAQRRLHRLRVARGLVDDDDLERRRRELRQSLQGLDQDVVASVGRNQDGGRPAHRRDRSTGASAAASRER